MSAENCPNHGDHARNFIEQRSINDRVESRLSALETKVEVNKTSTDIKLEHMDVKLDSILETIKTNQSRLPNLIWGVLGVVLGGVIVWLITTSLG